MITAPEIVTRSPLGIYIARCDNRGRVWMPPPITQYFRALDDGIVFLTSFEEASLRVYPVSLWRRNEDLLAEQHDDPQAIADVLLMAHYHGTSARLDSRGVVQLNGGLRKRLGFDGIQVCMDFYCGRLNVSSQRTLERRRTAAIHDLPGKLLKLEKAGLR
jgi:DNA-binding transcriptional regulator/RsmH inhibitor MraZ